MARPVSIRDIAEAAGVSHTTVSRALHNNPLISPEVREHIQILAREMGYTPNAVAQSLKNMRTNSIGLVVTAIADPFLSRVVRGVEEVAQRARMSVLLSASYNDPEREMAVIETFHQRRVDGIIVASSRYGGQYTSRLEQVNVPIVLINQEAETESGMFHSVSVNDLDGACTAVKCLLDLGHRKIGYLGAGNRPRSNRLRLQGYRDALQAAGITPDNQWMRMAPAEHRYHSDDVDAGRALLPDLLASGVTAVFCYNDMIAIGLMTRCQELGIPVPGRLSVIGFDDIELAQYVTPQLTTIHQPKLSLGHMAMEMLLDLLVEKPVQDVILPTELILRASAARLI